MVWPWIQKINILLLLSFVFLNSSFAVNFKKSQIKLGLKKVTVEIADTDPKRSQGLMNRKLLAKNEGMLFVFPNSSYRSFWMKNTFIPLSIGYFDSQKKLVEIHEMEPVTSVMQVQIPRYDSQKPAQYALEMNRGWFKKNKIKLGTRLIYPVK